MVTAAIDRVIDACARRAWLVIVLAALLATAAFAYTARHFAIDTDSVKLLSRDLPLRQRERAFDAAFAQRADLISIVIDAATPELAEQAAASLAQRLADRPDLFRSVRRPDGGPFFDRHGLLFLPADELARTTEQLIAAQPLLGPLAADPSLRGLMNALALALEGVRRGDARLEDLARPLAALSDTLGNALAGTPAPLAWRALITGQPSDRRELRRFVMVQPILDFSALQPGERATKAVRQAVRELGLGAGSLVRVRLTGPVPLADEEFATVADGAALNSVVTVAVVVALLWLALRSARLILAVVVNLAVGLIVTAAFGLLALGAFNLISVAFAVLFVGLGVDFGIQLCVRYRAERHRRDDLQAALRAAGHGVGGPLALAAASTAAGFYAFLPTDYRGVSELGLIAGTGMLIGLAVCISLLPALIHVLRPAGESDAVGYPVLAPLDRFLIAHRRHVLIIAAVLAAASLALLPRLRFDFNPLNLRSSAVESVATVLDLMRNPDTTPNTIDVVTPSIADAQALAQRISTLPEVANTITLASFVPLQQADKLALIADAALLLGPTLEPVGVEPAPTDAENARAMERTARALRDASAGHAGAAGADAERLAGVLGALAVSGTGARQLADAMLIPGLHTTLQQLRAAMQAQPVTMNSLPEDIVRDWVAADGRARVEVFPTGDSNDNDTLRRFVAAVRAIAPDATGMPVSVQESGRIVVRAFLQAGAWALASITLLLAVVLRRAVEVVLTLAPLLLAGLLTLALGVLLDWPLNFANIIALPLMFGIGVAFNIYFVMAWRAGATHLLQSSLTRAILFSALTTATAFGSLWFSHHPGTASMGRLLALSLACTLATALLFLPALLGRPGGRSGARLDPPPGDRSGKEDHDGLS